MEKLIGVALAGMVQLICGCVLVEHEHDIPRPSSFMEECCPICEYERMKFHILGHKYQPSTHIVREYNGTDDDAVDYYMAAMSCKLCDAHDDINFSIKPCPVERLVVMEDEDMGTKLCTKFIHCKYHSWQVIATESHMCPFCLQEQKAKKAKDK